MGALDFMIGMLLLPAALVDVLATRPVDFPSERTTINGREFTLYRARTREQLQHGFKGHDVAPDEAMLFEFHSGGFKTFWMRGTRSPLDIVFMDENFTVTRVFNDAKPCTLLCRPYSARARYVLEFRGGDSPLKVGEKATFE